MFSKINVNSRFAGHPTQGGFRMERLPTGPEPHYGAHARGYERAGDR